jgi:purine-cytosine permease-like protein
MMCSTGSSLGTHDHPQVGFVGGSIFSIFNILTQLGFSCTAVILGGQVLTNVSDGKLPLEASIVLVGFIALVLVFIGYEGEWAMHSSCRRRPAAPAHTVLL